MILHSKVDINSCLAFLFVVSLASTIICCSLPIQQPGDYFSCSENSTHSVDNLCNYNVISYDKCSHQIYKPLLHFDKNDTEKFYFNSFVREPFQKLQNTASSNLDTSAMNHLYFLQINNRYFMHQRARHVQFEIILNFKNNAQLVQNTIIMNHALTWRRKADDSDKFNKFMKLIKDNESSNKERMKLFEKCWSILTVECYLSDRLLLYLNKANPHLKFYLIHPAIKTRAIIICIQFRMKYLVLSYYYKNIKEMLEQTSLLQIPSLKNPTSILFPRTEISIFSKKCIWNNLNNEFASIKLHLHYVRYFKRKEEIGRSIFILINEFEANSLKTIYTYAIDDEPKKIFEKKGKCLSQVERLIKNETASVENPSIIRHYKKSITNKGQFFKLDDQHNYTILNLKLYKNKTLRFGFSSNFMIQYYCKHFSFNNLI